VTTFLHSSPPSIRPRRAELTAMRRLVMQIDLRSTPLPVAMLPLRFGWGAWHRDRAAAHAAVLYEGFRDGIDAGFMQSLSTLDGCHDLITATMRNEHFIPEACWLGILQGPDGSELPVSTIQVLGSLTPAARIQNLAVLPEWRGRGIARATLMRCLRSCRALGYEMVELEVTSVNTAAVELYRNVGFTLRRTYLQPCGEPGTSIP
jgi:ribosomal protein S18 acetylase RimI-like enzyme